MWWTDLAMRCIAKLWEGRSAVGSRLGYTKSLWNRARARVSWKKKGVWQQMWSATKSTSGFADPSFGGFWNHLVCAWPFCILNKMVFVVKFFLVDFVFCIVGGLYPARRYLHQGRQSSPPKFQVCGFQDSSWAEKWWEQCPVAPPRIRGKSLEPGGKNT